MTVSCDFSQDLDAVLSKLKDESFRRQRCAALHEDMLSFAIAEEGDGFVVTMSRNVRRELPSVLAKVFSSVQTLDFEERWWPVGDGWQGSLTMDIRSQPATVKGDFSLMPTAKGCRYQIEHRCNAKIPLIGGKVEKYVCAQTDGGAEAELQYLHSELVS